MPIQIWHCPCLLVENPPQFWVKTCFFFWASPEFCQKNRSNSEREPFFVLVFTWILARKMPQFRVKTFFWSSPEFRLKKRPNFGWRPFFFGLLFGFRCCQQTGVYTGGSGSKNLKSGGSRSFNLWIRPPLPRASERKFSRGYEGRYRAPKSYWAPQVLSGPMLLNHFFVRWV